MLDGILDSMKGQVASSLMDQVSGITSDQAEAAFPAAKESITEGLMGAVSGGNIAGITSMLSGGDMASSGIFGTIKNLFVGKLMSQVGLPESMAGMVSGAALPMMMNNLKGAVSNDAGEVDQDGLMSKLGMDSGGMMDALKGNAMDAAKEKLGGIGGGLGNLLG